MMIDLKIILNQPINRMQLLNLFFINYLYEEYFFETFARRIYPKKI
jgi:hypothetical protein